MPRPLAGSGEWDRFRLECLALLLSTNVCMNLQEVEMTLEDTISLVLSVSTPSHLFSLGSLIYLVASGGGCFAFLRKEPTSVTIFFSLLWGVEFLILAGHLPFVVLGFEQSSQGSLPGDISRHFPTLDLPGWGGALH